MTEEVVPTPNTVTTPEPPSPTGANSGQQPGGQSGDPVWLPERLSRAKTTAIQDFLRDMGVDTPDTLKALVKTAKDAENANKTEMERVQGEYKTLQSQVEQLNQKLTQAETRALAAEQGRIDDRIDNAIRGAATHAEHPEDVVEWVRQKSGLDLAKLVDSKGQVLTDEVDKAIQAARTARPSWFKGLGVGSPSNRQGKPPQADVDKVIGNRPLVRF